MLRTETLRTFFALAVAWLLPSAALAQEGELSELDKLEKVERRSSAPGFGVSVEALLNAPLPPLGAAGVVYDTGSFRIQGLLFLVAGDLAPDTFGIGGRFLYNVHRAKSADFALGGGLAVIHTDAGDATRVQFDGLGQIRFFVVDNVALHASLGLGIGFGDGDLLVSIGAQLNGSVGLSYFF